MSSLFATITPTQSLYFKIVLIEHRICKKATIIIIRTVENEELI